MKFFKSCESFSFFISSYVIFFIQFMYVYTINDDSCQERNNTLITLKMIFYLIFFLDFCSHFAVSFSDPGIIEKTSNKETLEFYNSLYKDINKSKEKYEKFNVVEKDENSSDEEDEYSENENDTSTSTIFTENRSLHLINDSINSKNNINTSSKDEINIKPNNTTQKKKIIISKKYNFELTRCKSCLVQRPKSSHHCSDCHVCVLERNNHCPWMNNCIGLFNRKYFILFCLYSVISVVYSFCLYFYYVVFKNFRTFRRSISRSLLGVFFLFFSFVYGGFCNTMLRDERNQIIKEFGGYGDEKKKLMKLKMRIIFGNNFYLKWFFPCFQGGRNDFNSYLTKKKKNNNVNNINKSKKKFNLKKDLFKKV